MSAVFQEWFLDPFQRRGLLLMTFAIDHAHVQIEQSTDTFTAFSHVQYPGSHVTLYTVFSTRVLEVRYSCHYVLLIRHCDIIVSDTSEL